MLKTSRVQHSPRPPANREHLAPRRRLAITASGLLLVALGAGRTATTQEATSPPASAAQLVRELREALANLDRVRAERRLAREQHLERVQSLDERIRRLESDLAREEETAPDATITRSRAELDAAEAAVRADEARIARVAAAWTAISQRIRARILGGIPYRRDERLAAFDEATRSLAGSAATTEAPATGSPSTGSPETRAPREQVRGIEALARAASEELRRSREREVWSEHIALADRNPHAYVARIGLALQLFVTEDLRDAGHLSGPESSPRIASAAERDEVVRAVQILQGRAEPRPVTLQVPRTSIETPPEDER